MNSGFLGSNLISAYMNDRLKREHVTPKTKQRNQARKNRGTSTDIIGENVTGDKIVAETSDKVVSTQHVDDMNVGAQNETEDLCDEMRMYPRGFIACTVLTFIPEENENLNTLPDFHQQGKDVVLVRIYRTLCTSHDIYVLIWKPSAPEGHTLKVIQEGNAFLRRRFCNLKSSTFSLGEYQRMTE